jgi:hypothetical protein
LPYANPADKAKYMKKYNATEQHKDERASRGRARYHVEKRGVDVRGKDVDHKNGNPLDNRRENLQVMSKKQNRSKK